MGFFSDMFSSMEKQGLEMKYGIRRPNDAVEVVRRILDTSMEFEERQHHLKMIIGWLKRLSVANKKGADEAAYVLKEIKRRWSSNLARFNVVL